MIYVTGIHGNEFIPIIALASKGIPQVIANPKAVSQGKRFIEKDLNSCFGSDDKSLEGIIAQSILNKIPRNEIVVDFHTMSAISDPFVIVVDKSMIPLAKKTGLKHIVYMKHNIKKSSSLIDLRKGISIEVGRHNSYKSFKTTLEVINNLENNKVFDTKIYQVNGIIENPGKYLNFKMHKEGFIPVLAGEKAYNFYGLKSEIINEDR